MGVFLGIMLAISTFAFFSECATKGKDAVNLYVLLGFYAVNLFCTVLYAIKGGF